MSHLYWLHMLLLGWVLRWHSVFLKGLFSYGAVGVHATRECWWWLLAVLAGRALRSAACAVCCVVCV
jgi:hypothetical protein